MTAADQQHFDALCGHYREIALLGSIESALGWDERCMLPPAGGDYRAEQMTRLAGLIHERETDPRVGELLAALTVSPLAADPHSDSGTVIRQLRRRYEKKQKLPATLVEELTRTSVKGQILWQEARKNNSFAEFRPLLEKMYDLKRAEADALGYPQCRYDALLDDYEQGETTARVAAVLAGLRAELVPLVAAVQQARGPSADVLHKHYPAPQQEAFGRQVAERVGFDFERGRLDTTAHPFCSGMGPHDCRITTRYLENNFGSALFGILHEAGHGMYEQGLRREWYGLPPGETISLGIHESQSRMWENFVGRSLSFWQYWLPEAANIFPQQLGTTDVDTMYAALNRVQPSLIRVEADETTYNLHILVRFELEQALLHDELRVADLPAAWNEKYEKTLGLRPPTDSEGVLQDIHWAGGLVGYFPTYSLGNLYAAQFFDQARQDLGRVDADFARGDFTGLLEWLREKIHGVGQCYSAAELVERVTGKPLSHVPLIQHLRSKLEPLYGL